MILTHRVVIRDITRKSDSNVPNVIIRCRPHLVPKPDSNVSNIIVRHRPHLVPLLFPFLGLTSSRFHLLALVRTATTLLLLPVIQPASMAEAILGRVGRGEQGEARTGNSAPRAGPHCELRVARKRLKAWCKKTPFDSLQPTST